MPAGRHTKSGKQEALLYHYDIRVSETHSGQTDRKPQRQMAVDPQLDTIRDQDAFSDHDHGQRYHPRDVVAAPG